MVHSRCTYALAPLACSSLAGGRAEACALCPYRVEPGSRRDNQLCGSPRVCLGEGTRVRAQVAGGTRAARACKSPLALSYLLLCERGCLNHLLRESCRHSPLTHHARSTRGVPLLPYHLPPPRKHLQNGHCYHLDCEQDQMLQEGLAWIDTQTPTKEPEYWFPGVNTGSVAS